MKKRSVKTEVAALDLETDPFLYGRIPKPFCAGFYSEKTGYVQFWGDDCISQIIAFISAIKTPLIIYAHNGGKFDFHYFTEFLENPIKIISSRIASVKVGIHEFRDSYCIIPVPLSAYEKDTIDYQKMERENREKHRDEILSYLKKDVLSLYDLVSKFIDRFGLNLTIGGTAIKILREMHPFDKTKQFHDLRFRPYYFGGRVECFKTGAIKGAFKVFDVNSMYPHVMRNMLHPTSSKYAHVAGRVIDKRGRIAGYADAPFYFARIECEQLGAFPVRVKNEPLNFALPYGEFYVTSHELKAAYETGRVKDAKLIEAWIPFDVISFGEYVDKYMAEKIDAKKRKDKGAEIFAKLLLNSAYGKFGQNPEHYYDYWLGEPESEEWELYSHGDIDGIDIWRKPSERLAYYDVATAASITGASRAVLMRALSKSVNPIYCDTDSIICDNLLDDLHESKLGAWKLEASGNSIYIGGKKLYALFDGKECVKTASKGVKMSGKEIVSLVKSNKFFLWKNDAPSFNLTDNRVKFIDRKIRARQN